MYKKGATLTLSIEKLAFGGLGVARDNDFVWFVERGIPGQTVEAKITAVKRSYGKAYVTSVLSPSPFQVKPRCPVFGICGGCQLQHLQYTKQAEEKTRQIVELIERIGKFNTAGVRPCIPCENIYGYRNKMEFSFSPRPWLYEANQDKPENFALGLHVPRRYDKVLDLDDCPLMTESANSIFRSIKNKILITDIPCYDVVTHQGFWRNLVIRQGINTGQTMINLITSDQHVEQRSETIAAIAQNVLKNHPDITTFIHSVNSNVADVATGTIAQLFKGSGKIQEQIHDRLFEISPGAFFQTNTLQTEVLFNTIRDMAGLTGSETVYDLYCGTGAIGICLANQARKVLGIEIIKDAVENGRINLELNKLDNMHFVLADMKDVMTDIHSFVTQYGMPDLVILDPPRGGTHPKSVKGLLNLMPPKIVYVSCNPAILARDIEILCKEHYTIKAIQPVDMFPHTKHIEVVTLFEKK